LKLPGCEFIKCNVKECYFLNTNLSSSDFSGSDLLLSEFNDCNLSKCDFSNATNYSFDLKKNVVKGAKFSVPEVMELLRYFEIEIE